MTLDGAYQGFHVATHDPGIAVITFNQPDRLNGISRGMKRDLTEIIPSATRHRHACRRGHRFRSRVLRRVTTSSIRR